MSPLNSKLFGKLQYHGLLALNKGGVSAVHGPSYPPQPVCLLLFRPLQRCWLHCGHNTTEYIEYIAGEFKTQLSNGISHQLYIPPKCRCSNGGFVWILLFVYISGISCLCFWRGSDSWCPRHIQYVLSSLSSSLFFIICLFPGFINLTVSSLLFSGCEYAPSVVLVF